MTFAILSFVPEVLGLFLLFVKTAVIFQRGRSMFLLLINLALLYSTEKIVDPFEEFDLE